MDDAMKRTEDFTREHEEERPMTVGDLRKLLDAYPDDMQIIETRYSDYRYMKASEWYVVEALPRADGAWLTRDHPSMSEEDMSRLKKYLHIEGN